MTKPFARLPMLACMAMSGLVLAPAGAFAQSIEQVDAVPEMATPLPVYIGGRVVDAGAHWKRQWPGTYFETAFEGREAYIEIGDGDVMLNVIVDAGQPVRLIKPEAGLYRISGLADGTHSLKVQVISESQAGATAIGSVYTTGSYTPLKTRGPQIEFIGDSHTVGYGNTSTTRDCTQEDVWLTTDTSQGPAGVIAGHYGADYQVNAISGRGIVRNYDGGAGDTLPAAYPFALLNDDTTYEPEGWAPEVVVISLGTNDFSTELKPEEKWATRDALQQDFASTYVAFVEMLHERYPGASFILWATDLADGEIAAMGEAVADEVVAAGDIDITFISIPGLAMSGCHYHPDTADAGRIADQVIAEIDLIFAEAEAE
ncbi:SGNH/GDSL hydrolase family protein [Parvularcula flava]|uniref:Lipase n=1 Tax=Aquisalinus luteolus TaxID=1566827 RepID=A0A8J3A3G7_9PROT|nr:SGNH/GDSL hydrolase family protein [Aquisalinus luteolus]NHK29107.1 SGNH/GDSL hydrolase family protein [Aquisalinus luteolus]GGI00284.1 lipase [Aquisalinus luteolus]